MLTKSSLSFSLVQTGCGKNLSTQVWNSQSFGFALIGVADWRVSLRHKSAPETHPLVWKKAHGLHLQPTAAKLHQLDLGSHRCHERFVGLRDTHFMLRCLCTAQSRGSGCRLMEVIHPLGQAAGLGCDNAARH
eukprot:381261-Amphidinium_carterae.2